MAKGQRGNRTRMKRPSLPWKQNGYEETIIVMNVTANSQESATIVEHRNN